MKGSSKINKTVVVLSLIVLTLGITVAAVRAGDKPDNADNAGLREVLVGFIDSIFERATPVKTKPSFTKTNLRARKAWHDREALARQRSREVIPLVKDVFEETGPERRARLANKLTPRDIPAAYTYFVMDSAFVNEDDDIYGPVRFMHRKHAGLLADCTVCHHYRPTEDGASETTRCSACHQNSFNPEVPNRIGLKGAVHRRCVGCHKRLNKGPL